MLLFLVIVTACLAPTWCFELGHGPAKDASDCSEIGRLIIRGAIDFIGDARIDIDCRENHT